MGAHGTEFMGQELTVWEPIGGKVTGQSSIDGTHQMGTHGPQGIRIHKNVPTGRETTGLDPTRQKFTGWDLTEWDTLGGSPWNRSPQDSLLELCHPLPTLVTASCPHSGPAACQALAEDNQPSPEAPPQPLLPSWGEAPLPWGP